MWLFRSWLNSLVLMVRKLYWKVLAQGADILVLSSLIGIKFDRQLADLPTAEDFEYFMKKNVK